MASRPDSAWRIAFLCSSPDGGCSIASVMCTSPCIVEQSIADLVKILLRPLQKVGTLHVRQAVLLNFVRTLYKRCNKHQPVGDAVKTKASISIHDKHAP